MYFYLVPIFCFILFFLVAAYFGQRLGSRGVLFNSILIIIISVILHFFYFFFTSTFHAEDALGPFVLKLPLELDAFYWEYLATLSCFGELTESSANVALHTAAMQHMHAAGNFPEMLRGLLQELYDISVDQEQAVLYGPDHRIPMRVIPTSEVYKDLPFFLDVLPVLPIRVDTVINIVDSDDPYMYVRAVFLRRLELSAQNVWFLELLDKWVALNTDHIRARISEPNFRMLVESIKFRLDLNRVQFNNTRALFNDINAMAERHRIR